MRKFVIFAALIVVMTFWGCAHHFDVIEYPIDSSQLPEIVSEKPLTLINTQNSNSEVLLVKIGIHSHYIDLKQFTGTAISTIKTALKKRNIRVTENSDKQLKLSVIKVDFVQGWWALDCYVLLKVETGDGYIKEYTGQSTNVDMHVTVNAALNHAVEAMLNDGPILTYLKQ
jgi:hypothetical protein